MRPGAGGQPLRHPALPGVSAMDLFPDGAFVRLRSRARRAKFVYADEDASGVSLRRLGDDVPSLNAVWKATIRPVEGVSFLLLLGVAYGRYLAVSNEHDRAPSGDLCLRAVQRDYDLRHVDPTFMWWPDRVEDGQNYVRLRNFQRCLRANARHRRGNNAVTVDTWNGDDPTKTMQWMVEAVPSNQVPLPLPPPPQPPIHARRGLFGSRTVHDVNPVQLQQGQRIRHVRTDDNGNYVSEDWPELVFHDNSVSNLMIQEALEYLVNQEDVTVRVLAGRNAPNVPVNPLVTNLPRNEDLMYIILLPAELPDIDTLAMHGVQPLPLPSTQNLLLSNQSDEVSQMHHDRLQCVVCLRPYKKDICRCCIIKVKQNVLDIYQTVDRTSGNDLLSYCLECNELVKKSHHHVDGGKIIPFDWYNNELVAWVTGKEKWSAIFLGIQSDRCFRINVGRPFLIYKQNAVRCIACNDVLTLELLHGCLLSFCSVKCWLKGESSGTEASTSLAEAMLAAEFGNDIDAICLTCSCEMSSSCKGEEHADHECLAIVTDSAQHSRVKIPRHHHLARVWHAIKGLGASWTGEVLIKDDTSPRCQNCRARLVDGGGKLCSLECSLSQHCLLPRPLLQQQHHG